MNYHLRILNIRTAQDSDVQPILCKESFAVSILDDALQCGKYENVHNTKITGYTVLGLHLTVASIS